jgi:hypothetical protein
MGERLRHLVLFVLAATLPGAQAQIAPSWSGEQIMEEVYRRHQQFPYVYEEQSMVLIDGRGNRDTRKLRRYSRIDDDGTVKFLLLFDSPREVSGVALLATRDPSGQTHKSIYLPAYGEQLVESGGAGSDGNFLGTDFSVESLTGEILSDYSYIRQNDRKIGDNDYLVIDVYQADANAKIQSALRRHYVRQDNFYITTTEHFDKLGRIKKIQSYHDLKPVDGDMWRANMILMKDAFEDHQSLIKINRRVFSRDYVPAEMFSASWIFANHPHLALETVEAHDTAAITEDVDASELVPGESPGQKPDQELDHTAPGAAIDEEHQQ